MELPSNLGLVDSHGLISWYRWFYGYPNLGCASTSIVAKPSTRASNVQLRCPENKIPTPSVSEVGDTVSSKWLRILRTLPGTRLLTVLASWTCSLPHKEAYNPYSNGLVTRWFVVNVAMDQRQRSWMTGWSMVHPAIVKQFVIQHIYGIPPLHGIVHKLKILLNKQSRNINLVGCACICICLFSPLLVLWVIISKCMQALVEIGSFFGSWSEAGQLWLWLVQSYTHYYDCWLLLVAVGFCWLLLTIVIP